MKKIEAWQCDYCAKCYINPKSTYSHQRTCRNNPDRHNCVTCVHGCTEYVVKNYPDPHDRNEPAEVREAWCDFYGMPIGDKPYYEDCDMSEGPLPGTCHHYKYKGYAGWEGEAQQ